MSVFLSAIAADWSTAPARRDGSQPQSRLLAEAFQDLPKIARSTRLKLNHRDWLPHEELALWTTGEGLHFEVKLPDEPMSRELISCIREGRICGTSLAANYSLADARQVGGTREIRRVLQLRDVSLLDTPGYCEPSIRVSTRPTAPSFAYRQQQAHPAAPRAMARGNLQAGKRYRPLMSVPAPPLSCCVDTAKLPQFLASVPANLRVHARQLIANGGGFVVY